LLQVLSSCGLSLGFLLLAIMDGISIFWKLAVKDVGELSEWVESSFDQSTETHVTLLLLGGSVASNDFSPADTKQAQEALQGMSGCEVTFGVTAVLQHGDMIVAEVDLPEELPCGMPSPHLILWRSKRVSPDFAYELLRDPEICVDSMGYDPPILLRGIVSLESQSDDPGLFEGKFLKVETLPRANPQAEPKGHATFLQEEHADAWKAKLASSVKEDPAGPEGCKLKANVQAAGRPGHIYLRWGAVFGDMTAKEIAEILEKRLQELMNKS